MISTTNDAITVVVGWELKSNCETSSFPLTILLLIPCFLLSHPHNNREFCVSLASWVVAFAQTQKYESKKSFLRNFVSDNFLYYFSICLTVRPKTFFSLFFIILVINYSGLCEENKVDKDERKFCKALDKIIWCGLQKKTMQRQIKKIDSADSIKDIKCINPRLHLLDLGHFHLFLMWVLRQWNLNFNWFLFNVIEFQLSLMNVWKHFFNTVSDCRGFYHKVNLFMNKKKC